MGENAGEVRGARWQEVLSTTERWWWWGQQNPRCILESVMEVAGRGSTEAGAREEPGWGWAAGVSVGRPGGMEHGAPHPVAPLLCPSMPTSCDDESSLSRLQDFLSSSLFFQPLASS